MWAAGAQVGDYRLLSPLGQGGMGEVFLAEHVATGARCAIKSLPLNEDPELLKRFRREGEAQARVDAHPNVVKVHTLGEALGRSYLVMDFAPGGDLSARLKEGPLPVEEGTRLVIDLARGLAHAHARGVLHRDLKPANVVFDEHGAPRLVDFGLARVESADTLTASGTIMGTPAYMAPEQVNGEWTERSDVYGLGALLYEVWTGRPPFEGGTVVNLLNQVLHHRPMAPSALNPDLGVRANALCLRALDKEPARRPASASDFADALEDLLRAGRLTGGRGQRLALWAALVALPLLVLALGLAWKPAKAPSAAGGEVPVARSPAPPLPPPPPTTTSPREAEGVLLGSILGVVEAGDGAWEIRDRVTIPKGQTARIPAGKAVRCLGEEGEILCLGRLLARGTPEAPVDLLRELQPAVRVQGPEAEAIFEHVRVAEVPVIDSELTGVDVRREHGALVVEEGAHLRLVGGSLRGCRTTRRGSGIVVLGGSGESVTSVECRDTRFESNVSATGWGAGLFAEGGCRVVLVGCRFQRNQVGSRGAAVFVTQGDVVGPSGRPSLECTDVEFRENSAVLNGGAIGLSDASARLVRCRFVENGCTKAVGEGEEVGGGAIELGDSDVVLEDCTFEGNHTLAKGGAILVRGRSSLRVDGGRFVGNRSAAGDGGALASLTYEQAPELTLKDVRFEDNVAGRRGGALYLDRVGRVPVHGCSFQRNRASAGTDIYGRHVELEGLGAGFDVIIEEP